MSGMVDRMKVMKQQLRDEQQRVSTHEQQVQVRADEIASLHARMAQTHEQHQADVNTLRARCDQLAEYERSYPGLVEELRKWKEIGYATTRDITKQYE